MATVTPTRHDYPTSDGRPIAETDLHRDLMVDLIQTLQMRFADDPMVYVSGNLLVYYVPGDKRRHVSPDVFVVKGVPKRKRDYFLIWEERKGPDAVIELTSRSTRAEDTKRKFALYERLKVPEYFLFDPRAEYLDPPLRGYRLRGGIYVPIRPVAGRLPSKVLGLHLDRDGSQLRLYDPVTQAWIPTPEEEIEQAQAEVERLRRELDALRRGESAHG
jgi:Uma2 family endonuclease